MNNKKGAELSSEKMMSKECVPLSDIFDSAAADATVKVEPL